MSLLRMENQITHSDPSTSNTSSPSGTPSWQGRKRTIKSGDGRDTELVYLFTSTLDSALRFLSTDVEALSPAGYMNPEKVFPPNVIKSVNYAIKRGAYAYVTSYALAGSVDACVGVTLELWWDGNLLGIYVMRLDSSSSDPEVCDD